MIYARRTSRGSHAQAPPESAPIVTPVSGAFTVYLNGAQVPDSASIGEMLAGTSSTITLRVRNTGAGLLHWLSFSLSGFASSWYTNTDGGAVSLSPGDFQDLVFTVAVPSGATEATRAATFLLTATDQTDTFDLTVGVKVASVDPSPTPPSAPTEVVATAGDKFIDVSWTGSIGADFYLVGRSANSGGPYTTGQVQVDAPGTYVRLTGLTNGEKWFVGVYAANNETGTSAPSAEAVATPTAPIVPDPDPELGTPVLGTIVVGDTFLTVPYSAVENATRYWVTVYSVPAGDIVAEVVSTSLEANVVGLTHSTAYDVGVYAEDEDQAVQGEESPRVRVTTSAATGGEPGTPPLDRSQTMTVYADLNAGLNNPIRPTANIRKLPAIRLSGSSTFAAMGEAAAQVVALDPVEHRMLAIGHVGQRRTDRPDLHAGITHYSFVESQGYANDSVWSEGMLDFWAAFRDMPLPYVRIDEEETGANGVAGGYLLPFWQTGGPDGPSRAANFAPIYANPTLKARLPLALRNSSVAELSLIDNKYLHPNSYLAGVWDHYIHQLRAKSLRTIIADTYELVTGRQTTVFNYSDDRTTRKRTSLFGMPMQTGNRSMSPVASPPMYIQDLTFPQGTKLGNAYRDAMGLPRLTKAIRWYLFIDYINILRASLMPVIPHLCRLRYDGDGRPFEGNPQNAVDLMKHVGAMGIDRHVWFCSGADQAEVDEYQQVVERVRVYPKPSRRLALVSYDATRVTTGAITTEYNEADWTPGGTYDPVEV